MKHRVGRASAAKLVGLAGLCAALAWAPARADEDADRAAAVAAATAQAAHWLDTLDAGDYGATWNDAAAVMKEGRNLDDWIADVGAPRAKLGTPVARNLQRADFATTVRGGPRGQYVTATYLSQFATPPAVLETVLLTFADGRWRIAGYNAVAVPDPPVPPDPADKAAAKPGD